MVGASRRHNLIVGNLFADVHRQLKHRQCESYASDMRVKVSPTGLYTYPDVVIVCDEPAFEDAELDTLLNPNAIVEVLSDSTEAYDRGAKFEQYRRLESLHDYVLVAQDRVHIEHFARDEDGSWVLTEIGDTKSTLELSAVACHGRCRSCHNITIKHQHASFPTAQ